MDIFVRDVPVFADSKQIKRLLDKSLKQSGVKLYHVNKMKNKRFAIITVDNAEGGQRFLSNYRPLNLDGSLIKCTKSRKEPNDLALQSLAWEAAQVKATPSTHSTTHKQQGRGGTVRFEISQLQCGSWEYEYGHLAFVPYFTSADHGIITFGHKEAVILLGSTASDHVRVDMNYYGSEHIVLGSYKDPTLSIKLGCAPKMYKVAGKDLLSAQLTRLMLGPRAATAKLMDVKKERLVSIGGDHSDVAGVCFVYRMTLTNPGSLSTIRSLLRGSATAPSTIDLPTNSSPPEMTWGYSKMRLDYDLTDTAKFGAQPFGVRFQLDRLARNARLLPQRVRELLPTVERLLDTHGTDATLAALTRFYHQVPRAGPDTDASRLSNFSLEQQLGEYAAMYDEHEPSNPYELTKRYAHINLIHKVVVTPAGIYLTGPEPEPTNRVLRKYPGQIDKFVRVLFRDEDGSSVRYDPLASQEAIYHERFRGVLDGTINIAGRYMSFLGFSHSSLRSQSCWFMAPLFDGDASPPLYAPQVIKELGDFTHIRTPSKCAARIGQCFTDTTASVTLKEGEKGSLDVVERNGRDFSDGCGTISRLLLNDVFRVYGSRQQVKPTVLQIRFQGAKGVVSLDSRLQGRQLLLRSNMEKFGGSPDQVLEICGASFRPLPMVLNRQFIAILTDLGVTTESFLQLQTEEVNKLRGMLTSACGTSSRLDTLEMAKASRLPSLITDLEDIGLDYHGDAFLYGVVEMAVVNCLRDIKYRGRINVSEGVTLYGIMDETGYLKEGEIYVVTEKAPDGGRREEIRNEVIITRSPAMHPGDVQIVNAVGVPEDSPLKKLSNVIVFSQHGNRDLPSMLSGGDLDGDIYNCIWDHRLKPGFVSTPADYPKVAPVELDRPVTAKDMSDFFVTFMETDQLGMLCTRHMQLADQREAGTFDEDCIKLAEMASTAVDYSKTGIPIGIAECPRAMPFRPDFMAPSPRVVVSEKGFLELEDDDDDEDNPAFEGLDTDRRTMRYYKSEKALGELFRAIDERQFITTMQSRHRNLAQRVGISPTILPRLLKYAIGFAEEYFVGFDHHLTLAQDIRQSYDDSLIDVMYNYCPTLHTHLSEQEVYSGAILGRQGGAQGKPLRELSKTMRERFDAVTEYANLRMVKGDEQVVDAIATGNMEVLYDDREFEGLPRAIACLKVAVTEQGLVDQQAGELKSFGYIAAGACLREIRRYLITTLGRYTFPSPQELRLDMTSDITE
ncbi:hypothetical protein LTR56_025453 [Elasticomyces elasticus]|nr:hypothetical protein LTR56_025453 [Elasticomyces elasticus]KAK3620798.1 hypothetical protein LTR22_025458 [Elasticomyces elasticus]KAK4904585.1 hypothetical protein LTR49_025989 [Elasticomyces elasticus]KAK5755809.1 hypothetical protein LTS12_014040 [Elasticomyces elasticus]